MICVRKLRWHIVESKVDTALVDSEWRFGDTGETRGEIKRRLTNRVGPTLQMLVTNDLGIERWEDVPFVTEFRD